MRAELPRDEEEKNYFRLIFKHSILVYFCYCCKNDYVIRVCVCVCDFCIIFGFVITILSNCFDWKTKKRYKLLVRQITGINFAHVQRISCLFCAIRFRKDTICIDFSYIKQLTLQEYSASLTFFSRFEFQKWARESIRDRSQKNNTKKQAKVFFQPFLNKMTQVSRNTIYKQMKKTPHNFVSQKENLNLSPMKKKHFSFSKWISL